MSDRSVTARDISGSVVITGSGNVATIYNVVAAAAPSAEVLTESLELFASLPLDSIPKVSALPAPSVRVPARNRQFVGREADLLALATTLKSDATAAVAAGIGGVGKTQLAVEFAHRYGKFFAGGVFWLNFADSKAIAGEVALCGGVGGLDLRPGLASLPLDDQVRAVAATWLSPLPRLLIFDNCEDEGLLRLWRPPSGGCRVLLTSRIGKWAADLGVKTRPIDVLSRDESIALLRSYRPGPASEEEGLDAIAAELGDLPLALHLAGSFMEAYRGASFAEPQTYLNGLRQSHLLEHASLIGRHGGHSPTDHDRNVARTFKISIDGLDPKREMDALALDLITRAACFAPGEPIPKELLLCTLQEKKQSAAVDEASQLLQYDALNRLLRIGLVSEPTPVTAKVHRLVGRFVEAIARDLPGAWNAVAATLLANVRQVGQSGAFAPLISLEPHLRHLAESAGPAATKTAYDLYRELGYLLRRIARYRDAASAYEHGLAIAEQILGNAHRSTGVILGDLGSVYEDLGKLEDAKSAFQRALSIVEAASGQDDESAIILLGNLGVLLRRMGDLNGARKTLERAIELRDAAFGPGHKSASRALLNLGTVLYEMGDHAGARELLERALVIAEESYGANHPHTGTALNNLGSLLQKIGDLPAAQLAYERALAIARLAHGSNHPQVALRLNNLATALFALGDLAGARDALGEALRVQELTFGSEHPHLVRSLGNLEVVLRKLGDDAKAQIYGERCERILNSSGGSPQPHPTNDFA